MSTPTSQLRQEPITGEPQRRRARRVTSLEVLCGLLVLALVFQDWLVQLFDVPALRTGATVFVAVCVQALPFLILGVLISGGIAAFVPAAALRRLLPANPALAVPLAGAAGALLPGCECASVPVAGRLMRQGVAPAVALTFLLAAPAINPVVLVATAVAFPGQPIMVLARLLGSLCTAIVMGWIWHKLGRTEWIAQRALRKTTTEPTSSRWWTFVDAARHDLLEAGGFLVLGAGAAAALNVLFPRAVFQTVGGHLVAGIAVMAVLAVVLAICSEADAFVASALPALPLLPKLVFLIIGPAVDLKLIALQAGTFGRSFVVRFAPLTFLVALGCAAGVGLPLLGAA